MSVVVKKELKGEALKLLVHLRPDPHLWTGGGSGPRDALERGVCSDRIRGWMVDSLCFL